jgi:TolB-like protein/DNA-binding SARP family transcriptional activator
MATIERVARSETSPRVRMTCWGDFALVQHSTELSLTPRGRKARALLAYLALQGGRPVRRERLTGLLWGDRADAQARASLRQAVLELKPLANGNIHVLRVDRDQLSLDSTAVRTDLDELDAAFAARNYRSLLALLPHPEERLFADLDEIDEGFDDWLRIERARRADDLAQHIGEAAASADREGDAAAARALATRLRELDPHASSPGAAIVSASPALTAPASPAAPSPARPSRWLLPAFALLLLFVSAVAIMAWPPPPAREAAAPTIAVLPFRNLSGLDAAFAGGLSDEITARLAREPGLRITGRYSARQFEGSDADPRLAARKLGVTHILDGSVRSSRGRLRIHVSLVRASDGVTVWAEPFDGTLDDIFAIQSRIGSQVVEMLLQRIARAPAVAPTPATNGAVYSAYLTARSLIRDRNPRAMIAAREQLERALKLDPNFAPAWSSMAQVKRWEGNRPGPAGEKMRTEALADARRALALAPDLAEAHAVLGMILGFEDPAGQRHVRRAVALDPENAEYQLWLGHSYGDEPDFPRMSAAYRRAFEIDPMWSSSYQVAAASAWRLSDAAGARAVIRRVEREGSRYDGHMARAALAGVAGDFSAAAAELDRARAATNDVGKQARAVAQRATYLFQLGLFDAARKEWESCRREWAKEQSQPLSMPEYPARHLALRGGALPSLPELLATNRARGDIAGRILLEETVERLILGGRARDAVALYDSQEGLLGLSAAGPLPASLNEFIRATPAVASALIAAGRTAEAERLLRHTDGLIAAALRRSGGRAPDYFFAEAAQTWALLGKSDAALNALDRAVRNGWVNAVINTGDLVDDPAAEPAFQGLRGDPRFEAIRAAHNRRLARERAETLRALT